MPVRNIVRNIKVEEARDERKCHRNDSHTILPGAYHLAVYTGGQRENFCSQCYGALIDRAITHLQGIKRELSA